MKVSIQVKDIYYDSNNELMVEIQLPDPDLVEPPKSFILHKNDMIIAHCKEWGDIQTA